MDVAVPFRSVWSDLRNTAFRQDWIDCAGVNTRYIEYVEIPRTSHWSQFESPEVFNRASLDFLQRHSD